MQYKIINNGTTAELKFYGLIATWWNGADDYTRTLAEIQRMGIKNVVIRTHCYGGSVLEGYAIWTANKTSNLNIEFVIDGIAASMMSIVMLSGNKVTMSSVAKIMVHAPRDLAGGTSRQLFETAKLLKSMEKDFVAVWAGKSKQAVADVTAYMDGIDYWFDAEECKKMGICDEIINDTAFVTQDVSKPDTGTNVAAVFERYVAIADYSPNTFNMNKKEIIAKFGLTGVDENSSETAIYEAISAKHSADISAAKVDSFKAQANTMIAAREAALNTKFTADQLSGFQALATSEAGIKTLETVLASMQTVPNITSMLNAEGRTMPAAASSGIPADRATWSFSKWENEDPIGLQELEKNNLEAFKKLYIAEFPSNEAIFK